MTPQQRNDGDGERLSDAVGRRRARRARRGAEPPTLVESLSVAGVLGWTVVLPALAGAFAGRWLDRRFSSGVFWTLGLLMAGLVLGCLMAWRRIRDQ